MQQRHRTWCTQTTVHHRDAKCDLSGHEVELEAHHRRWKISSSVGPQGLSADGNIIVGTADTVKETTHATAWVDGSTTATDLGTLGGADSAATAVSAEGNVIVGEASTVEGVA
jgi:probable HAF family extracellular repeat protein